MKRNSNLKKKKKILRGWVLQRTKVQSGVGKVTISPAPESKSPEAENSRHCPPRLHPPARGEQHPGEGSGSESGGWEEPKLGKADSSVELAV